MLCSTKQGSFWQPSIVSHLELYYWLEHCCVTVELSNVHPLLRYEGVVVKYAL